MKFERVKVVSKKTILARNKGCKTIFDTKRHDFHENGSWFFVYKQSCRLTFSSAGQSKRHNVASASTTFNIGFRQYSTRARSASCYLTSHIPKMYRNRPGCKLTSQARRLSYIKTRARSASCYFFVKNGGVRRFLTLNTMIFDKMEAGFLLLCLHFASLVL